MASRITETAASAGPMAARAARVIDPFLSVTRPVPQRGAVSSGQPYDGLMSEGRWFDAWMPWPELSGLAAAGRALLPAVPATPAALARTVTEQLVGRRLTTTVQGHEVGLTLTELDYPADSLRLATGRVGDVRIVAEDVDWPVPNSSAAPVEHGADSLARTARSSRTAAAGAASNARGETTDPTTADALGMPAATGTRSPAA